MTIAKRVESDLSELESQLKQSFVMGEFTDSESDEDFNIDSINDQLSSENNITPLKSSELNKRKDYQSNFNCNSILSKSFPFSDTLVKLENSNGLSASKDACTQTNECLGSRDSSFSGFSDMSFSYEAGILLSGRFDDYMPIPTMRSPKKTNQKSMKNINKKNNKENTSVVFCEEYFNNPQENKGLCRSSDSNKSDFSASVMMNVADALLRREGR